MRRRLYVADSVSRRAGQCYDGREGDAQHSREKDHEWGGERAAGVRAGQCCHDEQDEVDAGGLDREGEPADGRAEQVAGDVAQAQQDLHLRHGS